MVGPKNALQMVVAACSMCTLACCIKDSSCILCFAFRGRSRERQEMNLSQEEV